jgi:hypothetical protein
MKKSKSKKGNVSKRLKAQREWIERENADAAKCLRWKRQRRIKIYLVTRKIKIGFVWIELQHWGVVCEFQKKGHVNKKERVVCDLKRKHSKK